MASIKKESSGRYRARYRDARGRSRSQRFDKMKDAQPWLDGVTTAVQTGTYVHPKAGRTAVGQLAPVWLKVKVGKVKPKTYAGYESLLKVQVLPRWRDVGVSTITSADIEAWVSEMTSSGLSASRTRQAYQVLKGVLDTAVKARNLAANPAQSVDLPKLPESRRRYLTMAQLEALADAAGEYGLFIRVLGYCGLRWGEAVAIRLTSVTCCGHGSSWTARSSTPVVCSALAPRRAASDARSHYRDSSATAWPAGPPTTWSSRRRRVATSATATSGADASTGPCPASGSRGWSPRAQTHRGVSGDPVRGRHQGRPDHDGPRLRDHDVGPVRPPIR